jgi:hypothetical protein
MALGAFQASLNILIHYEGFYNGFYAPKFDIQLLGCNTKITDELKLNVFMHTSHLWVFHDDINVNVGAEVSQAKSWQQLVAARIKI